MMEDPSDLFYRFTSEKPEGLAPQYKCVLKAQRRSSQVDEDVALQLDRQYHQSVSVLFSDIQDAGFYCCHTFAYGTCIFQRHDSGREFQYWQ